MSFMSPTAFTLAPLLIGALLAAALSWLGMATALHRTSLRAHGYLHWVIPILLLIMSAGVWLGGRDLTSNFLLPEFRPDPPRPALLDTLQPAASLLLLALSFERIITRCLLAGDPSTISWLPVSFIVFWLGSTASPAWLGAHPHWSHDWLYPLIIGAAATVATSQDTEMALRWARDALLLLMLVGVLLIAVSPTLVLDRNYQQGLIAGLPRLGGLATHPVAMGLLAQLGLLCLLARPLRSPWLHGAAWLLGLSVLVLAQSKTAWMAFVLCSAIVLAFRWAPGLQRALANVQQPTAALGVLALALLTLATLLALLIVGDSSAWLDRLLQSQQGQQLSSLTGRDRIWSIAWEEWQAHRAFGWGPQIWGEAYRQSIGLANATHAHNQLMDTLSRAGLTGAATLLVYGLTLTALALRYSRATQGLSLALLLALLLRAGSEVPLLLMGYGPDLIAHLLLLMVLAGATQSARRNAASTVPGQNHAAAQTIKRRPI